MNSTDEFLDITTEVCPLTFVRAKLRLEKLPPGAVLAIRLKGGEPLRNVPRALGDEGHEILSLTAEEEDAHLLRVRRR